MEQELPILLEHPSSLPVFSGVPVTMSLVLCLMFCILLFVLLLASVLSVLWFTGSDYPFGIFFKIFLSEDKWLGCVYTIPPDEQNKSKRSTTSTKIYHLQFHYVYGFILWWFYLLYHTFQKLYSYQYIKGDTRSTLLQTQRSDEGNRLNSG